jgi:PAS domain S-box-containing protein
VTHAADLLFQFPDTGEADRGFVRSALNLATVPVMALDAGMGINVMNLQCEETLLRLGAAVGDRRRKAWPPGQMQTGVKACLRSGRAQLVREIVLGIADGGRRDALICPGKVRGEPLAFVILLPSSWEGPGDIDTAFDRLLEAFDCAVVILDEDLRFRKYNTRYLTTFGLEDDEVRGRKFSERSSSEQAKVMERQISYNMGQCKVLREQVMHMSTTRHGVVFASVWSWPLYEADVGCRGTVGLMRPLAADVPSPAMDEAKEILFGRTTVRIGPPMFFTHLDGKIVIMNAAARAMIAGRDAADQSDIKTAIPWRHPEIIDKLYEDIIGGSTYSGVITEVLAPSGDRICRVDAVGLKEVGDITSEVFVHVQDMTESERLRNLLADTARSLSVEKEILGKVVATVDLTFTVIDRNLIVVRLNELGAGKFDSAPQDLIGRKVTDLSPNVGRSGLLDYIKIAIEHGRETHVTMPRSSTRMWPGSVIFATSSSLV